jgi:hypothetical protein
MKSLAIAVLSLATLPFFAQAIPEMKPELGILIDKSPEGEVQFYKFEEQCKKLWAKYNDDIDQSKLAADEKEIFEKCISDYEGYWDVIGPGCSWYCGGGQDTISVSSNLKQVKGIEYTAKNIHDLNYKTAWIEGAEGYGIGETITYHFPPATPRITEIIIVNGYVKSEQAWKDNSRVKKLKMYIDAKPFAVLNLADSREEQHFKFEPLGYQGRKNWKALEKKPWWTIKFEILEVYNGDKYADTAITEIYFDGIDVH